MGVMSGTKKVKRPIEALYNEFHGPGRSLERFKVGFEDHPPIDSQDRKGKMAQENFM